MSDEPFLLQQGIASGSFSPHSRVAAEAFLAAANDSNGRRSALDQAALLNMLSEQQGKSLWYEHMS